MNIKVCVHFGLWVYSRHSLWFKTCSFCEVTHTCVKISGSNSESTMSHSVHIISVHQMFHTHNGTQPRCPSRAHVTGLRYCPVPPDPLSAYALFPLPLGWVGGQAAWRQWPRGSTAHAHTHGLHTAEQAGPLSSWHGATGESLLPGGNVVAVVVVVTDR